MRKLTSYALLSALLTSGAAQAQESSSHRVASGVGIRPSDQPNTDLPFEREEVPPHAVTPHDVATRSLRGPRAEVISGVLVTASAPLVGMMVALLAGPGIFECAFEEDPACEARRARERDSARRLALGTSIPWALVGIGLIAHGAHRVHEIRVARRSVAFTPSYDFTRRSAGLQLRF